MSFEWNSWPYIQYAYVRSLRILENFDWNRDINDTIFENSEEIELIKILSKYDEILNEVVKTNSPHILAKYSYDLTKIFNNFYNNVHILNEENNEKKISRLKLVELFSKILKDSFKILGIDMPNKM
jgi:arginyl-tRNA synthetase